MSSELPDVEHAGAAGAPGVAAAFEALADYVERAQPEIDRELLERVESSKAILRRSPVEAVHCLAGQFENQPFLRKDLAYDLLILLEGDGIATIRQEAQQRDPLSRLWLISALHLLGDISLLPDLGSPLSDGRPYVRHLAALTVVFQGLSDRSDPDVLVDALVDALQSRLSIEGSPYYVADSALTSLSLLAGRRFGRPADGPIGFANFDDRLFEPPLHPFPYSSERISLLPPAERTPLLAEVAAWRHRRGGPVRLNVVTDAFRA